MAALFGSTNIFATKMATRRIAIGKSVGSMTGIISAAPTTVVGAARGEVIGATFRFSYIVALRPPSFHVCLDQTMTLLRDGSVENRATIRKLGFPLSRVRERFQRVD